MFLIPFAVPCAYAYKAYKSLHTKLSLEETFKKELEEASLGKKEAPNSKKITQLTLTPSQKRFLGEKNKDKEIKIMVIQSGDKYLSRGTNFLHTHTKYAVMVIPETTDQQLHPFFMNRAIYHIKYNEALVTDISATAMSLCAAVMLCVSSMHVISAALVTATVGQVFKVSMRVVNQEEAERFAIRESSDEGLQSAKTHLTRLKDRLKSEEPRKKRICVSFGCIKKNLQIALHSYWIHEIQGECQQRIRGKAEVELLFKNPNAFKREHEERCSIS